MKKLLIWTQLHLSFFLLLPIFWGHIQRLCPHQCHEAFSLVFSRSFTLAGLAFKSLIHFKLILYLVWDWRPLLLSCHWHPVAQHYLLRKLSFLHCVVLATSQRSTDHKNVDLFLGSLHRSIGQCICFNASTMLFGWRWLSSTCWNQAVWWLQFCSSCSDSTLATWDFFVVP